MGDRKNRSRTRKKNKKAMAVKKRFRQGGIIDTKRVKEQLERAGSKALLCKTPKQTSGSGHALCSEHFPDNQYVRATRRKGLVHDDAVPSIFPSILRNALSKEAKPTGKIGTPSVVPEKSLSDAVEFQEKNKRCRTYSIRDALVTPQARQDNQYMKATRRNGLIHDAIPSIYPSILANALSVPTDKNGTLQRSQKQRIPPVVKERFVAGSWVKNEMDYYKETCDEEYITPDVIEEDKGVESFPESEKWTNTKPKSSSTTVEVLDVEPDVWFLVENLYHTGT